MAVTWIGPVQLPGLRPQPQPARTVLPTLCAAAAVAAATAAAVCLPNRPIVDRAITRVQHRNKITLYYNHEYRQLGMTLPS